MALAFKAWNFRAGSGGFRAILGFGKCSNYSLYFQAPEAKSCPFRDFGVKVSSGFEDLASLGSGVQGRALELRDFTVSAFGVS